jgi:prepilin-type N-terminal cleavage/methylation domain-containing protein
LPRSAISQPTESRHGVTLIELLIVMMIIAIGFFALRPSFGGAIKGLSERTALRQLVGLFASARAEAVARGKLVRVVFAPEEHAFLAEIQAEPEIDRSAFYELRLLGKDMVRVPGHLSLEKLEVAGAAAAPGRTHVYFYPDGHTDGLTLVLADATGRDTRLEVSPATGRVRIDG